MYVFLLADEKLCKCTVVCVPRNDYHSVWATDIPPRETGPAFLTGVAVEAASCAVNLCQCGNISPDLPHYIDSFMSKSARVAFTCVKSVDIADTRVRDSNENVSRAKSWQCYMLTTVVLFLEPLLATVWVVCQNRGLQLGVFCYSKAGNLAPKYRRMFGNILASEYLY